MVVAVRNKRTNKEILVDAKMYEAIQNNNQVMLTVVETFVENENLENDVILTYFDETSVLVSDIINDKPTEPYMIDFHMC